MRAINPGATFNTFGSSLTNTGLAVTNTATKSSMSNTLTNVGLSAAASGADRNYALLVPAGQVGIDTNTPASSALLDLTPQPRASCSRGWARIRLRRRLGC